VKLEAGTAQVGLGVVGERIPLQESRVGMAVWVVRRVEGG
jgi:hypothetical protein